MTLHLLKAHLQTFLSIPITKKCQILSCGILVGNERYEREHLTRSVAFPFLENPKLRAFEKHILRKYVIRVTDY
jgi:hypothetical protein